ncbi:MAG: type IV toxin-antitoxin system AbiEi family antitoxin domain-containing protein [Clostridiales bacterium]|nr:type IV toxin-antitoxin system AbiEi family antitoxin domain-containing protein [Clostridiales bacterium]
MTGSKKLEELIEKSGGVITTKLVETHNIHRQYLGELVKEGKLERVAYGVYITPDVWEDKMYNYQIRKGKMIYSHETALYLLDLTDRDPLSYSITVPYGYNASRLKKEGLIIHSVKKELFNLGMCMKKTIFGNEVKTYNMERTICDVVRDRNNQDVAVVSEALKRYINRKDKDINKLMNYARLFRIENVLRPYLEVLL